MKKICYLDMDGVLVDFVRGAFKLHGKEIPMRELCWNFNEQLGIPADLFWKDMGHDFWLNLDWTHEGRALLAAVEDAFGKENIVILTSPIYTPGGAEGKVAWIKRHMPSYSRQLMLGACKHLLASPNKVLIDDHSVNVSKFIGAEGIGLLVPRPWNWRNKETCSEGTFDVGSFAGEIAFHA